MPLPAICDGMPLPPEDLAPRPFDAQAVIDQLYRTESPGLLRKLARRGANLDDAQDQLQEIFCRLSRLGRRLAEIEKPQAYLRRAALNLTMDQSKQDTRRSRSLHLVADEGQLAGVDPGRLLESRDMLNRIEMAMVRLRPKTREIFMAHRIDGLSYAEIADRMGMSIKGVEKQMSKALRQIDRLVGQAR